MPFFKFTFQTREIILHDSVYDNMNNYFSYWILITTDWIWNATIGCLKVFLNYLWYSIMDRMASDKNYRKFKKVISPQRSANCPYNFFRDLILPHKIVKFVFLFYFQSKERVLKKWNVQIYYIMIFNITKVIEKLVQS